MCGGIENDYLENKPASCIGVNNKAECEGAHCGNPFPQEDCLNYLRKIKPEEMRRVEILLDNDEWTPTDMELVQDGMTFRMFEPTGEPVVDNAGNTQWVAIGNAYLVEGTKNLYGVKIKEYEHDTSEIREATDG